MSALSYSYSGWAVLVLVTAWGSEQEYDYHADESGLSTSAILLLAFLAITEKSPIYFKTP
jgi:hypothetical protein